MVVGLTVTAIAAIDVYVRNVPRDWLVLAALTLLSGSFTIKIPGLLARLSVSDAFVFSSVLLFGPSPATVIVAIDSLVATLWMRPEHRSLVRSLFNVGTVALAIWSSSHIFFWLADATPGDALNLATLVGPLFVLAALYFLINSWLVAFALAFERHTNVLRLWWKNFPWFSLNYFGGVSVAALLVSQTRSVDLTAVGIIVPLLAISYLTYRTSLGRVEDAERHVSQVNELYISTIETLAMAVDAKDQITHGHIRRVQVYAVELAKRLGVDADDWTDDRRRAVLLHELAHVVRYDCLTQTLAAIACAFYWMHPGAWWVARRLRVERELACDDLVLSAGTSPRDYASHLLEIAYAFRASLAPAVSVSMASPRQLEGRMLALLDSGRNRAIPSTRLRAASLIAATALLVVIAAATATTAAAPLSHDSQLLSPNSKLLSADSQLLTPRPGPGTWEIRPARESGMVYLRLTDGDSSHGHNIAISRLSGLSASQLSGGGRTGDAPVVFSLRYDAGTFNCEGIFRDGIGAGTFTFAPDTTFAAELVKRGYERPDTNQLRLLAYGQIDIAFLDELRAQAYQRPALAQIIRAAQHGVDPPYLREMGRLGYRAGTLDALIRMRDHGVDPDFIREMGAAGHTGLSADDLVRARDHGVGPEFIGEMSRLGLRLKTLDDLVRARDHGVTPEFVSEMTMLGSRIAIDELVRMRDHGVSPDFIRDLGSLGYSRLTVDELVMLRDHGVSIDRVEQANARSGSRLSVLELKRKADNGWR